MRRQVKFEYLFAFKFYFVEKRMYVYNENKEIMLNYVVKNTSLRK